VLRLFVERPILSSAIAILILLAGLASIPTLPIAEFPQITPPTVTVTSTYIGANAATVESAVTNPLEEQINGVQGLRYMSSSSSNAGVSTINLHLRSVTRCRSGRFRCSESRPERSRRVAVRRHPNRLADHQIVGRLSHGDRLHVERCA
jgi:Cu/Ag efflux pump CusA